MTPSPPQADESHAASVADIRAYEPGDEAAIVRVLRACHEHGWGDEDFWRWKHAARPAFDARDVRVASLDGEVVGCFHFAVLPVTLEEGLEVDVSVDGDFAVVPDKRKLGIPVSVIDRTDPEQRERGAVLRGGFTSEALNDRFYNKQFGQVFVPSVTTQYRKMLGPGPLMPRVAALGETLLASKRRRSVLARWPAKVDLVIAGFPGCHVRLAEDGFALERGAAADADFRVRMPYALLTQLADGPGIFVRHAMRGVLRGQVRVSGLVRRAPRLLGMTVTWLIGR